MSTAMAAYKALRFGGVLQGLGTSVVPLLFWAFILFFVYLGDLTPADMLSKLRAKYSIPFSAVWRTHGGAHYWPGRSGVFSGEGGPGETSSWRITFVSLRLPHRAKTESTASPHQDAWNTRPPPLPTSDTTTAELGMYSEHKDPRSNNSSATMHC
ncbi:hypothetical protein DFH07DRAFT_777725 [Mycena maculata]|uniref:Uncharacterized protein n=1 Tax=Mycena maculata TaxID=230809 RepID=A0AAD7IHQ2_9AGAR|nr:hypothetical protein DFH07DRAFT_777725 [Mycena maculata]